MNHPTPLDVPAQPSFVLLAAEPTEDVHHGAFGRFFEGAQGDVLSLGQQGFGFSHGGIPCLYASSLNKTAFSGIPFHLNSVEAS